MDVKQRAEALASSTYTAHRNTFKKLKGDWIELEKRYFGKIKEGSISQKTRTKTSLNDAYSIVENAIPRLVGSQPTFHYLGREKDDEKPVESYNDFASYQWDEAGVQDKLKTLVKWGGITGTVGWKMGWKNEILRESSGKRTVRVFGKEFAIPGMKIAKKDDVTKNYTFDVIRPYQLIWSVSAEEPEEARVFGFKETKPLEEWAADGFNVESLREKLKQKTELDYWQQLGFNIENLTPEWVSDNVGSVNVEIAELYVKIMDAGAWNYFVIFLGEVGGDSQVIETRDNTFDQKFTPMGLWRPSKKPGKMHGMGLIEPVKDILDSKNDLFNIAMENLFLDIARPMEYNISNIINEDELEYSAGTLIPVRKLGETVRVLETPRLPTIVGMFFDYIQRQQQNVSGITDFQTGAQNVAGDKTLGEIQIKTNESNSRLKMMLDSLEKEVLEPIGRMALMLNKQYLKDDKKIVYRILGGDGQLAEKSIKFTDLDAIKDVVIMGGSSAQMIQQSEFQKWSAFINQANQEMATPNPVQINKTEAWRRLIKNGMMVKDIETFIPSAVQSESTSVSDQQAQLADAKSENLDPSTARVLPTDNPDIHIPLHKAAIQQKGSTGADGQFVQLQPEMVQLLMSHLNDHTAHVGGMVQPEMQSAPMQAPQGKPQAKPPMQKI